MTIASGTLEYQLGTAPVTGCGFSYSTTDLEAALSGSVAEVVFDDSGKADIEGLLADLTETDFEKGEMVERILSETKPPEDWRVGEALAESYLVHQKNYFSHGRMVVMNEKPVPTCREQIWLDFNPMAPTIFLRSAK